jgi:hypothetical protein
MPNIESVDMPNVVSHTCTTLKSSPTHSNPVLSGRHLEILALLALGLNAFYVQSKFAVSQ